MSKAFASQADLAKKKITIEQLSENAYAYSELYASVKVGAASGRDLRAIHGEARDKLIPKYGDWVIFDHCLPFDVTRAYDEATKFPDPRIWTAQRDKEMWASLEG